MVEIIALKISGVELSNGNYYPQTRKSVEDPSVLYDAIAVIVYPKGLMELKKNPSDRDFITDAFVHCKFIGYSGEAICLIRKAAIGDLDKGCVLLNTKNVSQFTTQCNELRFWQREFPN